MRRGTLVRAVGYGTGAEYCGDGEGRKSVRGCCPFVKRQRHGKAAFGSHAFCAAKCGEEAVHSTTRQRITWRAMQPGQLSR
jgi:hypothetical protein